MIRIPLQKLSKICSSVLLVFTLISIGFMLGKNAAEKQYAQRDKSIEGNYIAVYYLHSTFRCETCNKIEAMTKDILDRKYAREIEAGKIRWEEIDFMKESDLAEQYDVAASCVVVAQVDQGNVSEFQRLDEVWTLMADPPAFEAYISKSIDTYLDKGEAK